MYLEGVRSNVPGDSTYKITVYNFMIRFRVCLSGV